MRKHTPIDPMVDCVFKAILGDPQHTRILIHFLNAVLKPEVPIERVTILNPYNPREHLNDKLTIVDVKAEDRAGRVFQVEVQLSTDEFLRARMLYTWAVVHAEQLNKGERFESLRPTYAIWLLRGSLLDNPHWHSCFQLRESETLEILSGHCEIHVLELAKWSPVLTMADEEALDDEQRWLYFFKEASGWTELPALLQSPPFMEAMTVISRFKDKGEDYWRYQARLEGLRVHNTLLHSKRKAEEALAESEAARAQSEAALDEASAQLTETRQARIAAEQEAARLRALLQTAGLDPNAT